MPFVKGQVTNRLGRPRKDSSWAELMRRYIPIPDRRAIIEAMAKAARAGDPKAAKVIMDRMDGHPNVSVELSGNEDKPLVITDPRSKNDS